MITNSNDSKSIENRSNRVFIWLNKNIKNRSEQIFIWLIFMLTVIDFAINIISLSKKWTLDNDINRNWRKWAFLFLYLICISMEFLFLLRSIFSVKKMLPNEYREQEGLGMTNTHYRTKLTSEIAFTTLSMIYFCGSLITIITSLSDLELSKGTLILNCIMPFVLGVAWSTKIIASYKDQTVKNDKDNIKSFSSHQKALMAFLCINLLFDGVNIFLMIWRNCDLGWDTKKISEYENFPILYLQIAMNMIAMVLFAVERWLESRENKDKYQQIPNEITPSSVVYTPNNETEKSNPCSRSCRVPR